LGRKIAEFRRKQSLAYPVAGRLALIAMAIFSGVTQGYEDLADYAATLSQGQLRALRVRLDGRTGRVRCPRRTCFQRVLTGVNAHTLEQVLLLWQEQVLGPVQDQLVVLDGKEIRHAEVESVSAVSGAGRWLGSTLVQAGSNEIPAGREQLAKLDLVDKIVLADAAHTQVETVKQILYEQGGDYLLTVKKNQKTLFEIEDWARILPLTSTPPVGTMRIPFVDFHGGSGKPAGRPNLERIMAELIGNMLVAQSGGPTAVINASLAGAIQEAGRHPEAIEEIYGGLNGILGILNEDLIDLQEERRLAIEGLKFTPAAGLGTCRYKVDFKKNPEKAVRDMDRLFEVFQAHNIRYFFYAGGNDSQDTSLKIHEEAIKRGWEMRVIGVPKTIDNDLPHTDHCPGYGSAIKYAATTVMEVGIDVGSMATDDGSCCIIEVMGRSAGWIAAGTVLAKRGDPAAPPHIILLPEIQYNVDDVMAKVKETVAAYGYCIMVVGEGIRDHKGEEIGADKERLDAFGHPVLAGAAIKIKDYIQEKLNTKTRTVLLGYSQRAAAHCASATDAAEAAACGEAAVRAAVAGQSGYMVKIVREQAQPYKSSVALHDLREIANVEHFVPREWVSEDGFLPNEKFIEYARPLIEGEVKAPTEGGLPKYIVLAKSRVEKKLPPRA